MKFFLSLNIFLLLLSSCNTAPEGKVDNSTPQNVITENLPDVFRGRSELTDLNLKHEAAYLFALNQIPQDLQELETYKTDLRNSFIKKSGIIIDPDLPLEYQETGSVAMEGYTVKNILFQTRPGVYATASLYVPDGTGPFPAVLAMHGHWAKGKLDEYVQSLGHTLAANGYVCLLVDAFGSGERATVHGNYEYHGSNLGASLLNLGESLLGFQVSDNMRGVDLLSSLPFVDSKNIGATGASGGGNQTFWISAIDERIKASVPVVSIGTFESYVLRSNCVCELMVDGLALAESAGVVSLIAPRALKMVNHLQESIPAFFPAEMQRTYDIARPVYAMYGKENNIEYQLFDLTHGYWKEDRQAMIGWFDLHLKGKGDGKPVEEKAFKTVPAEKLMVYNLGQRDPKISNIPDYCKNQGTQLRDKMLETSQFNTASLRSELKLILRAQDMSSITGVHGFSTINGWKRIALETSDGKFIPILYAEGNSDVYTIIINPEGKKAAPAAHLNSLINKGHGIILADLTGTGEISSAEDAKHGGLAKFHTLARAEIWLGKSLMGEWVKELNAITTYAKTELGAGKIIVDGTRDAGLAALFMGALKEAPVDSLILRESPVSYIFDSRENVDFYSLGIHLPGILKWGDVSLAAALAGIPVQFVKPLSMSGNEIKGDNLDNFRKEFEIMQKACKSSAEFIFEN